MFWDTALNIIKVLFVEDEPDIRFIVELSMKMDQDIEFISFEDGLSALSYISETGDIFDFALLNLQLPHMTGIELYQRLRVLPGFENIASAMITGSIRDAEIVAYKSAGIKGHIGKPFDPLTLASEIRRIYDA